MEVVWVDLKKASRRDLYNLVYVLIPELNSEQITIISEQNILSEGSWLELVRDFDEKIGSIASNFSLNYEKLYRELLFLEEESPKLLSELLESLTVQLSPKKYPQLTTLLIMYAKDNSIKNKLEPITKALLEGSRFENFKNGRIHLNSYFSDDEVAEYTLLNNPNAPGLGLSYSPIFYTLEESTNIIQNPVSYTHLTLPTTPYV